MDATDFTTLVLLASNGGVRGKTKLQKTVYFLGLMTSQFDDLGYRPHFYGPYSDDISDAITTLKTIGAVDQNISTGGYDQAGFEVRRYDFRLNEQGVRYAEAKARQNAELWCNLQVAMQKLKAAGEIDYMQMSIAAKTYFMLGQQKGAAGMQELALLAPRFGWSVSPEEIKEGAAYLERLGLVELARN